jgi:hypothetical protein
MSDLVCYKEVLLPDPPSLTDPKSYELGSTLKRETEKIQDASKNRRTHFESNGEVYKNSYYRSYSIPDVTLRKQLTEWFENIEFVKDFKKSKDVEKVNYNIHLQSSWGANWHSPHVDYVRKGQLIYILEPGGDDITTTWYYEVDQPIHRDTYLSNILSDSQLVEITSVKLKPKTWYYFSTEIIHGARGMTGQRTALCVTFKNEKFHQKFLSDYINNDYR